MGKNKKKIEENLNEKIEEEKTKETVTEEAVKEETLNNKKKDKKTKKKKLLKTIIIIILSCIVVGVSAIYLVQKFSNKDTKSKYTEIDYGVSAECYGYDSDDEKIYFDSEDEFAINQTITCDLTYENENVKASDISFKIDTTYLEFVKGEGYETIKESSDDELKLTYKFKLRTTKADLGSITFKIKDQDDNSRIYIEFYDIVVKNLKKKYSQTYEFYNAYLPKSIDVMQNKKDSEDLLILTSEDYASYEDEYNTIYTYNCSSIYCKKYGNTDRYVLIDDDGAKIIDLKTKSVKNVSMNLDKLTEYAYEVHIDIITDSDDNIMGYLINNTYREYDSDYDYTSTHKYIYVNSKGTSVLTTDNYMYYYEAHEAIAVSFDDNYDYEYYMLDGVTPWHATESVLTKLNDNYYVLDSYLEENDTKKTCLYYGKLYDKNMNELNSLSNNVCFMASGDNLVVTKDYYIYLYDENYTVSNTVGPFENVYGLYKDKYALVKKNNKIVLIDYNTGEEIVEIGDAKTSYTYINYDSGWCSKSGKDAIYFVFRNSEVDYGETGSQIEFYYEPSTGKTGYILAEAEEGGYAKPVLYLYPEKKTNVTIEFEHPEYLTTTYPKYENNWTVSASENGTLTDKSGKNYYALYWEESGSIDVDFSEGFYVTKDNAITFLEDKLSEIGLNERESNEFIMYWLPILEKNEKSLVYFELTEERQGYNKLNITPQPDSLLRMAIHVKKVDKKVDIKEQKLTGFKRLGFTAVEWGGVIHN